MTVGSDSLGQLSLLEPRHIGVEGTFAPNKTAPVHRWYRYLEGYSASFVESLLSEFTQGVGSVYDPFAGSGTTLYVASQLGLIPAYSEVNPFMRLVVEAKTNGLRAVYARVSELEKYFTALHGMATSRRLSSQEAKAELALAFGQRAYFEIGRLREIVALRRVLAEVDAPDVAMRQLALVILGSIVVESSELIRAGDLRYRKTKSEIRRRTLSPIALFATRCEQVLKDIDDLDDPPHVPVRLRSHSALDPVSTTDSYDLILTSPPYLNGTNYFRNTKLELWATGLMQSEHELRPFRDQAVTAGINDVVRNGRSVREIGCIEEILERLRQSSYDSRIPELVRRYFSDASIWIENIRNALCPGGHVLIDIGNSSFAGNLVPTERILTEIAATMGLELLEERMIRARRSKDGTPLKQVLLVLRSPTQAIAVQEHHTLEATAKEFAKKLPHKEAPFKARNWGHGWHSLCSYQGKLKPAIAHLLIREFTNQGETILDPMSGAGTIPLEASLQGRVGWGNDLQELGYVLTAAKTGCPDPQSTQEIAQDLIAHVDRASATEERQRDVYSGFGMNGKLRDYFHRDTYFEILAARDYMATWPLDSPERALVYSALLHILHGNRPYALSRRSHPVTPFKPVGPFEYRRLGPRLTAKIDRALSQDIVERIPGRAFNMDLFDLDFESEVDAVVTSPPFAASTRFYVANWMRLWLAGWEPSDFEERRSAFLEERQRNGMSIYSDFFRNAAKWLRPGGRLIMHVGRTRQVNMVDELIPRCLEWFSVHAAFDEDVIGREKFGIRDQGATTAHQYLFLERH